MTGHPPLEQSLSALDAANQIRVERSKLRRRITSGDVQAASVLEDLPDCMRGCGVFTFVEFLPSIGHRRAFALLRKASVPGHKRLEHLTPMQSQRLAGVVREYQERRHPAERGLS